MTQDIKISGYSEAVRIFDQLTDQMQRTLVRQALRKSAQPMVSTARARAPKRTGQLSRSIGVVSLRRDRVPTVIPMAVGPVFSVTKNGKVNAFYARFVHDGTKDRRPRNKKLRALKFPGREGGVVYAARTRGMKARPFLRDAFDQSADASVNDFGADLTSAIERFVNRNFRKI